ncbi:MAG: hypothetical protein ACTHNT_12690, partial [Actinomycetales bacterium]
KDVPAGALALNVSPQRNIEGWTEQKRPGTAAAEAAARARDAVRESPGTDGSSLESSTGTSTSKE